MLTISDGKYLLDTLPMTMQCPSQLLPHCQNSSLDVPNVYAYKVQRQGMAVNGRDLV